MKKIVQKQAVKHLIRFLSSSLKNYTFEEILEAVPEAMDIFTDEQIEELIETIQKHRKKHYLEC